MLRFLLPASHSSYSLTLIPVRSAIVSTESPVIWRSSLIRLAICLIFSSMSFKLRSTTSPHSAKAYLIEYIILNFLYICQYIFAYFFDFFRRRRIKTYFLFSGHPKTRKALRYFYLRSALYKREFLPLKSTADIEKSITIFIQKHR